MPDIVKTTQVHAIHSDKTIFVRWNWILICLCFPGLNSLKAQYSIQTNGVYAPQFQNEIDVTISAGEISDPLNIGFDFNFFGNSYSQFSVSSNGYVSFQNDAENSTNPQSLPDPADPNDLIAFGWNNYSADYLEITYETIGTAPFRSLHVNFYIEVYDNLPMCPFGFYLYGQLILYESTNIIEIHTENWDGGICGVPSTQGIENEDGTAAFFVTGRNNGLWNTTNSMVRYLPDSYLDLEVVSMEPVLCDGLMDIRILVRNVGGATVDTFYADWTWDGAPQDAVNVYTTLPPNSATEVVLGQQTVETGSTYFLKAWTYDPENQPDHYTLNDTISGTVHGGLAGTLTIGGVDPDYMTIEDAISDLMAHGACDTVIFNIRPGTYTEELDINNFFIATDAVVIFQSETNNPADVIITRHYTSGSSNRMIEINNASHIRFTNLTLKVTGTVCSSVVYMNSYCADVYFTGCHISGPNCNSSTAGAVISLVNGQKDNIRFENNVIRKGSYGIYVAPGFSSFANHLELLNNTIDSTFRFGAYFNRVHGLNVIGNSFFSPTSNVIGIETNTTYGPTRIERNSIYLLQGLYAMRVYRYNYNAAPLTDTLFLLNNMLHLGGTISNSRTLSVEQSNKVNIWHNTIHTTSTQAASYGMYSTNNSLTDLRNSIITHFGAGRAAWLTTIISDHNVFHNTTPPLISNGTDFPLLENWVLASGQDQNSLQVDPAYVSSTDLHVSHGAINNAGDALMPPVGMDFDLEVRNTTTPDIGADEFGFLENDMTISDILFSNNRVTGENELKAVVFNIGLNDVNSFAIEWRINDNVQTPINVNAPIPVGGGDTITLGIVDLEPGALMLISVNTHLPNGVMDPDMTNDTMEIGPFYPVLNGLYTVGGDDPDFPLLSLAFQNLAQGGVLDSVAFAVRDGLYNDPLSLTASAAYACTKPIHVYGESLDAADVVFTNNNLVQPTVRLNGVHGIRFSHLTFQLTASAFNNVVIVENGSSCNSFSHCVFIGRISTQTTTAYAVVLCNANQGVDNDFYSNTFTLGSYGLYTNGPSSSSTSFLVDIVDNTFFNNYNQGLAVLNSRNVNVIGNIATITEAQHTGYTGISLNNCKSMELSHNTVINPFGGATALGFGECDGTLQDTTRVYNNYVYSGASNNLVSIFGGGYSNYTLVTHNTSRCYLGHAAGFSWSSNFRINNNIFESTSNGGVALELLNMQGTNVVSDRNCLYAPNGDIGEFQNVRYKTMAQWQALGHDPSSLNINPLFDDLTFHAHAVALDGMAIPYAFVTDDLDGDERHPTTPDIGADEFDPLSADAGMLAILQPRMPFPTGINPVYVRFYNNSEDTLHSVQFDWEVNGNPQPTFTWNGLLTKGAVYDSLEIGQFEYLPYTAYHVKIWVSEPNGMPDQLNINDTLEVENQYAGLAGVYTIGGEDPDFETITEAVTAINAGGASAPVTFNLRNGIYTETILLEDFPGSDCDRPVIFQSESGDSSQVTITNLGINAHTIVLNGADGVHFKNMTLKSVNTSFRHVVLFSNGSHCNRFEGNNFKGFQSNVTVATSAVIRSTVGLDTANVILNNRIIDGSFSIHLVGNGGGITNTVISGNHLEPYYRGIYNSALQGVTISFNTILADNHTSGLGMELHTGHNLNEISYNTIVSPIGLYGIFLDNCDNTAANRGRIYNNFISFGGTNVARGIYLNGCAFQDILHNSVLVYSTNATLANTTPLYLNNNPSLRVWNNALKNNGSGYAIYSSSNTSLIADHNAYFTNGTTFGFWNAGAAETTFADWQNASGQDTNSINTDPQFISNTNLHTFLVLLNDVGKPNTGVLLDYDGEVRDSVPDIGADEFDPLPQDDAGIFMFGGPSAPFAQGVHDVIVVLKNFGGNALTSATIRWSVNGIEQTPVAWTGNLSSSVCDTIIVGNYPFEELTQYIIDAWTEMPNDLDDANPNNDLLTTAPFYASLEGTYTVGGFAPDFNLVSELETILNTAGIVGHVTFQFRPGTYSKSIILSTFPKINYAHSVTFESESGDSTDVILTQNANNAILIDLVNVHHIKFRKLTLVNTKGHVFQIRNGSSVITIENSELQGSESLSSSRSLIYSPATDEDSISIIHNRLHEGYYSIYLYGATHEKNHVIHGNTFTGSVYQCIHARAFENLTITGNSLLTSGTSQRDVYMFNGIGKLTFSENRILSDNTQVAVFLSGVNNTSPNASVFSNNYIYKSGTTSSDVVYFENLVKINIDFNTIYNALSNAGSAALYTTNLSTYSMRNNVLYSVLGPAYQHITGTPAQSDYNSIFSIGPVQVINQNISYNTLPAYATATSTNTNSKSVDPLFVSSAGPEITQYQLNGSGITVAGTSTDILGVTRSIPPDMGAIEFTPLMHDVKVAQIISPANGCGLGTDEPVSVVLVNQGSVNETGIDIQYTYNSATISENIGSLIIPAGDSLVYTFSEGIDASTFGTKTIEVSVEYAMDQQQSNDTLSGTFTNFPPFENPVGNMIPVNGAAGFENQVSLSWSPAVGAVKYDLYHWPSTGAKPALPTHPGLTTINKLVTGLTYGQTYNWQVHAINICDEELPSATSSFTTRFLPDLVIESIVIPATAFSGQTIAVEWVVKNQGTGITAPGTWYDNIYLSADPTYNSFDPLLASVPNLTSLSPSQSYTHFANVILPQGTNGLYYIIVKTDHYNAIKESSDANNTSYSSTQMNVALSPPPDLIVINISTPTITFSGQSINITYEVKNIGSGITAASIWKDDIHLLPAPGNSGGSFFSFGSRTHTGQLLPDSSYIVQHTVSIPQDIFGDYQIRIHTDSKNDVFEFASEGNNQTLSSVFEVILTPPVDLVPDSLEVPAIMSLYETYPVTFLIRNEGGSAPPLGWTDRYYLSQSPVYNTNFLTLLGNAYHNPGLPPGESNNKTVNVKLTQNISGVYYIYLFTDYSNKINEYAFEGNNILRSDPITIIRPDIKPDSMIHEINVMSGTSVSLRAEVINPGPGVYKGTLVNRFYLSDDDVLSTESDILLTSKTSSNILLTTTDTVIVQVNMMIPAQSSGSKYILWHADPTGAIHESNETNNIMASPITIFESPHPDLVPSDLTVPDTIHAGVPFGIAYTLSNTGNVAVNTSVVDSFFLSFSPTWNRALATPLGYRGTSLLDTGAYILHEVPLKTSFDLNPNEYYIYVWSDATSKVYEGSGESNNILRSDLLILLSYPATDIAIHSISGVPDTLTSGQLLPISYTIQNLNPDPTYFSSWNEKLYFSTDSIFDPLTDMLIQVFPYSGGIIEANSGSGALATVNIPHGITGDYYLFVETDYEDVNEDTDRTNNSNTVRVGGEAHKIHVKLAPYPDLVPTDFVSPVDISSGQFFTITTAVSNLGAGTAGQRTDKIFVSTNNTIESGDLALVTVVRGSLLPGATSADTFSVFVPANYSGNYFLIYAVDYGDVVYEFNADHNNILLSSIIATPPPPADLIVQNILVPDSLLAGNMGTVTWQTKNQGQNPANGQFREILYLSTDTLWQVEDEVLAIWDGPVALATGAVTTKSVEVPYNRITNGDYHTLIRTDARNNIPESNEENNEAYSYDRTNVDIEEIFLDIQSEMLLPFHTYRYFKVEIPAEEAHRNMLITLTGDSLLGVNEVYVKYGSVPTEADHDFAYMSPFSPHQRIIARNITPGYYYIMVKGFMIEGSGPQTISLLARIILMEIISMSPNRAGNAGYTTIEVLGSELDSIVQVKLVLDDSTLYHEIVADTFLSLDDGARILARFNLTGQPLGHYHLLCHRESIWMASYQRGLEIIQGGGADLQVYWDFNPKSYNARFNSLFQIKIDVENRGDSDAEDRFIRVNTPNFDNPVYYSLNDYYNGIVHPQLILASEDLNGFPGILRPGGRRTFYVFGSVGSTQGFSIYYDK